jgi:hypothetical protein
LCLALCLLAVPVGAAASTARRASAHGVAPCATAGLVVWIDTMGNGTAGSIYYDLELTNLSGKACSLTGYPGVSAVSLLGRQLGSAAARSTPLSSAPVTLAAGATKTALLQIVEAGNFPAASCAMTTAAGLRVYPPGATVSKVVPFPFSACAKRGPIYLRVGAVSATASPAG